ncbi:MAG: recombination protein F [bacterium ADurb.Bin243]|nr:MAG: recombination protein F [bacterium ADurb.Bin243]HOD39806.1 AAA family ATPase [Candidatus Wallbacteria bacterium]
MLKKIKLESFTAFDKLEIDFSSGINIFIGENGTGKTHILKSLYSACDISKSKKGFAEKINDVFFPANKQIGRLTRRTQTSNSGFVEVKRLSNGQEMAIRLSITNHTLTADKAKVTGATKQWSENPFESVFIPVKDMMANAPGFRSLYSTRNIHFEEVYADIIDRAFLPALKGPTDKVRSRLLEMLQESIDGKIISKKEEFFLKNKQGELEFTLLAEGYRKLGLLWLLIQNGTLLSGSALFWDEPEANLNPTLMKSVVNILVELQRMGVQIFIATHDYVLLKEFDLAVTDNDKIIYHSLYRDKKSNNVVNSHSTSFQDISPNAIDDAFGSLIDRQVFKDMGGKVI